MLVGVDPGVLGPGVCSGLASTLLDPFEVDDVKLEPITSKKIAQKLTNVTRPRRNGTPRRVGWSSGNGRRVGFTAWKRRSPSIRTLTPTAVACRGRNRARRS